MDEDLKRVLNVIKDSIRTGLPYEVSYKIKDKQGNFKLMEEKGRPTFNSRDEVT